MSNLKINVTVETQVQIKVMAPGTIFFFPNAREHLMLRTQEAGTYSHSQGFVALDGRVTYGKNQDDYGIPVKEATLTVVY